MRAGMHLLLAILRSHSTDLPDDSPQWEQALAVAEEEHILPWFTHLLSQHQSTPGRLLPRLRHIQRDATIAAFYWGSELKLILRAFHQKQIRVVPLKGPFLAERLYGDAALRVSYDLDLLVQAESIVQAEAVLADIGFLPGRPDDYHRQWFRGTTTVELHHEVANPLAFNFHTADALRRAQPAIFQGEPCFQLAATDELPFLCLHAVRHRFDRLSVVLDLCLALKTMNLIEIAAEALADPERCSLLTLGVAMARHLHPEREFTSPVRAAPPGTSRLAALSDRLWQSMLTQTAEPLDWRALHGFYLAVEDPDRRLHRRIRHARILLGRLIGPDYQFAARFGCHRTWQVRLLRPIRLICNAIRPPNGPEPDNTAL